MASAVSIPAQQHARVRTPLALFHLLSLDAPTVCAVWTAALGVAAGHRVPLHTVAAIWLAVWLVYAADRLLDVRARGLRRTRLHARHAFTAAYARWFVFAASLVAGALAALLVYDQWFCARPSLSLDIRFALALAAYFAMEHALPARWIARWAPIKNAAMVAVLGAAVAAPVASIAGASWRLAANASLLALACWLNCRLISAWEGESRAVELPPFAALAAFATAVAMVFATHASLASTAALSAALLLLLNRHRNRLAPLTLRALADIVLLAPALLLLPVR